VAEEKFDVSVFRVPAGQKRAGMWTFTVNGQETLFYSSNAEGCWSKFRALLEGRKPGAITLQPLTARARSTDGKGDDPPVPPVPPSVFELPTAGERIAAFLSRGKLGRKPA
jgi:hypothetical protein